jgi:hypothetical protein
MFDFLCYQSTDSYLPKRGPESHIRILHTASASRKVDIYASRYLIASNLTYKKYTPYFLIPSGQHKIGVYLAGTKANPYTEMDMKFDTGLIYTLSLTGETDDTEAFLIPDLKPVSRKGLANIRFINLSPAYPLLDLFKSGGDTLFSNAGYRNITAYLSLEPGKYSFLIKQSGSGNTVLTISDITLKPDWNYTVYAAGLPGEKKGLQALILLDGSTYINNKTFS